jgi:hypothetical protein
MFKSDLSPSDQAIIDRERDKERREQEAQRARSGRAKA